MKEFYKGYKIESVNGYGFFQILNPDGQYLKNDTSVENAKTYIDRLESSRH